MGWQINVEGAVLREEDVKAAHVSVVNAALDQSGWESIDPISSPGALIVWCAVAVSEFTGKSLDETLLFIQSKPIAEVIGFFTAEAPVTPVEASEPAEAPPVTPGVTIDHELYARLMAGVKE